ncbi:MAG TPA: hypothetical protein PLX89_13135 [Verrucomicrobiota bacterium]|nr:hypothetical protein [Verrucomicrobiota bacterium]
MRIYLRNLDALDNWLTGTASFIDKIPAAQLKDESTSWKIGTSLGYRVAHIEDHPVSILGHANDACAL